MPDEENHLRLESLKCVECGYTTQPETIRPGFIIKIGDITFTGCPNCLGIELKKILGRTHFGNLVVN